MDNVFELIAQHYTAAADLSDADYMPTTQEVWEKLQAHTGLEALTLEAVFAFLDGAGYRQYELGDLYFVWLMKSDFAVLSEG